MATAGLLLPQTAAFRPLAGSSSRSAASSVRHTSSARSLWRSRPASCSRRAMRVRHVAQAQAQEPDDISKEELSLAPVKPQSAVGQMLAYYYKAQPHLFKGAIEEQFGRIKAERDAPQQQNKHSEEVAPPAATNSSEMVLFRRMEELKRSEQRATVEDLMYAAVLEKFLELGLDMLGSMENVVESSTNLNVLTEGIHSQEALQMVREHVLAVMGPASMAFQNTQLKMSKLQAAQVYAASIMFGYFLRRVDKRFQLERSLGLIQDTPEDAVAKLERLFTAADSIDSADDPDNVSSSTSANTDSSAAASETSDTAGSAMPELRKGALRRYVDRFDQQALIDTARLLSIEANALVQTQTTAMFGDIKTLTKQMQEAVGRDASSAEEVMQRVQDAVQSGRVESLTITVGTQRRAVLEAIAFGTFLRDVETWVDTEYALLTPAPSAVTG